MTKQTPTRRALLRATAGLATVAAGLPLRAAEVGQPAPPFALPGRDGNTSLAELRGKVVFLDFWASWCVPCRHSFPWMNQMHAKYASRGLQVLAINVDAKRADADAFLAKVPAQFAIAFDPQGHTPRAYGVKGMPTSVLIGTNGEVLHHHSGFRDDDKGPLEGRIVAALGGTKP
jgi:cytochrome c biogenesis protein CcmG, thiol:disulfide interchange protein DsbE